MNLTCDTYSMDRKVSWLSPAWLTEEPTYRHTALCFFREARPPGGSVGTVRWLRFKHQIDRVVEKVGTYVQVGDRYDSCWTTLHLPRAMAQVVLRYGIPQLMPAVTKLQ